MVSVEPQGETLWAADVSLFLGLMFTNGHWVLAAGLDWLKEVHGAGQTGTWPPVVCDLDLARSGIFPVDWRCKRHDSGLWF